MSTIQRCQLACMHVQVDADAAGPAPEPLDSYVLVNKDDVVDAIGTFVAAYLVQLPEAEKLKPEELQAAVRQAFQVTPFGGGLPDGIIMHGRVSALNSSVMCWSIEQ